MKICHVITRLIVGGAQENTLLTCRGLAERGHEVTLVAGPETGPEGSLWDETHAASFHSICLQSLRRNVRPVADVRAIAALKTVFRRIKPDVVHTHSSKAGILARTAAAAVQVPGIVHTIHGMSFNRVQAAPICWFYRQLERRAARCTNMIVTVADAMIDQSVSAGIAPRDRFVTIRSGMETNQYGADESQRVRCRLDWGVGDGEVVVGTVARMFDNKGYADILRALPGIATEAPQARFVWIGGGARRRQYERRVRQLGLSDRVILEGLASPADVARKLTGFDVLLHASRWEGLPRAVVQALLTEVPAVSFDNDGAPEVVLHEKTGLLVPFADAAGLSSAVLRLVKDAPLRRTLGAAGREHCLEMFDWRRMVEQLERLYVRLATSTTSTTL